MAESDLNILITATNEASPALAAVGAEVKALDDKSSSLGSSFKSMGSSLTSIGSKLTMGVTVPIVAIGAASIKMATDFQQQMEYVRTQAGDTTDSIAGLSQQVLNMAKNSAQGPQALSEGLFYLASLGYRGADAINKLNIAQQMATVGGANMADTTRALGAALVTGIKGTQDMSSAAGTLDATVGAGAMKMQDLVAALGTGILPAAKNFGLSLNDVGAALAVLTDNGMRADEAATRLKMSFALMAAPSAKAAGIFNEIGLNANQLGIDMQKPNGLAGAIKDLHDHLSATFGAQSMDQINSYVDVLKNQGPEAADAFAAAHENVASALSHAFGGGRSSAAIMTLLQQYDRLGLKTTQIAEQSGQFGEKYAATQETAAYKFHAAWSSIQANLIDLGSKALPVVANALTVVVKFVSGLVDWFDKLSPANQKMVGGFLLLAAAIGPALMIIGALASAIGAIIALGAPIAITIAVIIGLAFAAIAIFSHWNDLKNFFSQFWKDVVAWGGNAINTIAAGATWLAGHWFEIIGYMIGFFATLPIKIFVLMTEGMIRLIGWIGSINWVNVFIGLLLGFSQIMTAIWNMEVKIYSYFLGLDWGKLFMGIARGIGNAMIDLIQGAINGAFSGIPGAPKIHLPHFASGVRNFGGGLAVVGEQGPELVNLPSGSDVYSNSASKSMGGDSIVIQFLGTVNMDSSTGINNTARQLGQQMLAAKAGIY